VGIANTNRNRNHSTVVQGGSRTPVNNHRLAIYSAMLTNGPTPITNLYNIYIQRNMGTLIRVFPRDQYRGSKDNRQRLASQRVQIANHRSKRGDQNMGLVRPLISQENCLWNTDTQGKLNPIFALSGLPSVVRLSEGGNKVLASRV
jgi:hypothetical protein